MDGFRIDALKHLYENKNFENEPVRSRNINDLLDTTVDYNDLEHVHSTNQRETYEILGEWRAYCNNLGKRKNSPK